MKIMVGSLRYSPIFKSHCFAFGRYCESIGHQIHYLLSSDYEWMIQDEEKWKCHFISRPGKEGVAAINDILPFGWREVSKQIKEISPDLAYMQNVHPHLNLCVARTMHSINGRYVQHVHEPFVEDKSAYGGFYQYGLWLFELVQDRVIMESDVAVVSSQEAKRLFLRRFPSYEGRLLFVPLMYEDLASGIDLTCRARDYFTFIGPPSHAKGFDKFMEVAAKARDIRPTAKFQIVSRMPLENSALGANNIYLSIKSRITDEEMCNYLLNSRATIAPFKSARQSSSVLTSFMCGTPALAADIGGLSEAIEHGKTGYMVKADSSIDEWINELDFIEDHLAGMSIECRKRFVDTYSGLNWNKYFDSIVGE